MNMNQELELAPTVSSEGDAAAAFGQMAARLALLEAAITGLAAQRSAIDIPDYSETLGEIASDVEDAAEALEKLAASPLLALTPEQVARQISQAGKEVREADHGALTRAQAAMDGWARSIGAALASARATEVQRQQLIRAGGVGVSVGAMVWAILPGPIARALPTSWHLPERMATRTLGGNMWSGGERLLQVADSARWQDILTGSRIMQDNQEKIEECRKATAASNNKARCLIRVNPTETAH
jgi:Family of unknown function (DUF6118)